MVARLGRYQGTLEAGRHRIVPFVDTVVRRYSRDRDTVALSATCTTRDGESVVVEGSLGFRVTEPALAYLATDDPSLLASGLATGIAQRAIGKLRLAEARERTREVEAAILREANSVIAAQAGAGQAAGIEVLDCSLERIDTPALIG